MLEHTTDLYNGVIISSKSLPDDEIQFGRELEASLTSWKASGRKGVWLRLPVHKANFLPIALAVRFVINSRYVGIDNADIF